MFFFTHGFCNRGSWANRAILCLLSAQTCIPAALAEPAATALPEQATNFSEAGHVTVITNNATLDINHHVDNTVLNWNSFNIGRDATVNFNQTSTTSLTVNRINDLSASQIFGQLNANGKVWLVNQNGIVFGAGAQVNVAEGVFTTLDVAQDAIETGITAPFTDREAAFKLFTDENGNVLPSEMITIADGADINGDRIIVIAPDIENNGLIQTPDGQTILAAGHKVYITGSEDINLRGLLVEVDGGLIDENGNATPDGSGAATRVTNLGDIVAERGNVTLVGMAVNQNGRTNATTSVSANGSIHLLARDGVSIVDDANTSTGLRMQATRTGKVSFGENSITQIEAELNSDAKAIDAQAQLPSEVIVSGQKIHLKENSLIEAKGGIVQLQAEINPENTSDNFGGTSAINENVAAVIQMESGSRIDVSGNDVTLDMSRNNLAVELRGNELKDLPVQKDGEIRGQEVIVDLRNITSADDFELGDISAALATVEKGVAERTSEGGIVSIISEGEVRLLDGSEIDVSGGTVTYNSGDISYTELDFNGQTVNIHDADPNRVYDGIAGTVTLENQPGFIEGKDAGTLHIAANGIIADADLTGTVDVGTYQRVESNLPQAGRLIIGFQDGEALYTDSENPGTLFNSVDLLYTGKSSSDSTITISSANTSRRAPNVTLQDENFSEYTGIDSLSIDQSIAEAVSAELQPEITNIIDTAVQDGISAGSLTNGDIHVADTSAKFSDELGEKFADQLLLSTDFLTEGGFSRVEIYSNGNVDIVEGAPLNLAANTQLTLEGNSVTINRDLISASGDISINTISTQIPVRVDANNNVLGNMLTTYRNRITKASTSESQTFLGLGTEGNTDNFLKLQLTNGNGDLTLSAQIENGTSANVAPGQSDNTGIFIADDVTLDVSGDWTNDISNVAGTNSPDKPITLNGGTISLSSNLNNDTIEFGESSKLIVMGGAHANASKNLSYGNGGDVSIALNNETSNLVFEGNNKLQGHAPGNGGTFSLQISGDISIQQQADQLSVAGDTTFIDDAFFSESGFSTYDITTAQGDITIQADANLQLKTSSLFLPSNVLDRKSSSLQSLLSSSSSSSLLGFKSGSVNGFANSGFLSFKPDYLRTGQTLNLQISAENLPPTADRTNFIFSEGASIYADADSSITLLNNGGGFMEIAGDINAKGADLNLQLGRQAFQDFSEGHALIISNTANIDVSSKVVSTPDPKNGLNQGYVTDAGNIDISSGGILLIQEGANIKASGDNSVFEFLTGIEEEIFSVHNVYGSAGTIDLFANEFIILNGALDVAAADVSGAYGGTINIAVDGNISIDTEVLTNPSFDGFNPDIILSQSNSGPGVSSTFEAGDDVIQNIVDNTGLGYDDINNKTYIAADDLMASGADSVKFTSNGSFNFQDSVTLEMKRDIAIDTSVISSMVTPEPSALPGTPGVASIDLTANHVSLGSNEISTAEVIINDDVVLNVNADAIQLKGNTLLQNISTVNLNSNGDILLRGADGELSGEFRMMGDLELTADRIYPATMTDFTIDVGNSVDAEANPNVVTINPGGDYGLTLSAGGSLTIEGDVIEQGGTLLAPEGEINLLASQSVTFLEDSLTSVSANGLSIFLGQTETNVNGTQWVYTTSDGRTIIYGEGDTNQNAPQKAISIVADDIDIQEGAEIDISGGGDILTYQFVPGPGGSNDFGLAENAGNYFAVIPALDSEFAPFDASEFDGWNLEAGQSVYLAGGNGLDEGEYVILPARYALLPGAYLVESVEGYDNIPFNQSVSSFAGGTLVAGRYTTGSTDLQQSNTQGFIVRSGSFANKLSELDIRTSSDVVTELSNSFDQALPRLAEDAGRLTLQASNSMNLDGTLLTAAEVGARGAQIDIASDVLRIVNTKDGLGGVELLAENLNKLGAESLFLGGQRTETKDAVVFDVLSDDVTLESGAELEGPEIILAARNNLVLQTGSSLTGSGDINQSQQTYDMGSQHSAIARVSANEQVSIERANVLTGTAPNLIVEQGAVISATTSVTLDSSGNLQSFGTVNSPSQFLGAGLISIGDIDGALGLGGLVINLQDLENIKGQDLVLRTSGQIDLYGEATLDVQTLEVNATGFVADQASNTDFTIMANDISIGNDTGDALGDLGIATPNGLLTIETNSLTLNSGEFSFNGFSNVTANVAGDVIGSGEATLNVYNGDLNLNAARLTALTGADIALNAISGSLSLGRIDGVEQNLTTRGIGARLSLDGESVNVDTNIDMPVGQIEITSAGNITLGQNADIQAEGYSINVVDVDTILYDAGKVNITSTAGNIHLQEGSRIDVSASEEGGSAGDVELIARSGDVSVSGELLANSESAEMGGRVLVDANTLGAETADPESNQFSQLNTILEQGNFSRERELQLGQGNIVVEATDVVSAQSIKLVANDSATDNGSITVAGQLQTVGETEGGQIELIAQNDLTITSSADLSVAATTTDTSVNADAGKVFLQATEGNLAVQDGATFDFAGHQQGADGELHMRVTRTSPTAIAVSEFNPIISGNGDIIFEGVQVYNNQSSVDGTFVGFTDAVTFMNNGNTIKNNLGVSGDNVHIRAGVEIRNDGDISVSDTVDLSMWRSNDDEVGYLTIRASGDLLVNADIKDGIGETRIPGKETCTIFGCTQEPDIVTSSILDGDAWGINLVAGAEVNNGQFSADIYRTNLDKQGSLILAADTIIRSSTADINIAAANNLSLTNANSLIYTMGERSGFELDAEANGLEAAKYLPHNGGSINIRVGNDIVGADTDETQLFNQWFNKQEAIEEISNIFGTVPGENAGTYIDIDSFAQGIAAFGGGDISIQAGNDIKDLSVSAPTNVLLDGETDQEVRIGDGDIHIAAGGDIEGGIFFVGDGDATITADGDITAGRVNGNNELNAVVAVMGGTVDITARGDVNIDAIYNPTTVQYGEATTGNNNVNAARQSPVFVSYTDDTSVSVRSIKGDLNYNSSGGDVASLVEGFSNGTSSKFNELTDSFGYLPGDVHLSAAGNVEFDSGFLRLMSDSESSLEIYAGNSIRFGQTGSVSIEQSDTDKSQIASIDNITTTLSDLQDITAFNLAAAQPIHSNDNNPSYVVAQTGDIVGGRLGLRESARVFAGNDISEITFKGQNNLATELTRVEAGRDIILTGGTDVINLSGPGRLEVIAGRDIDLGQSDGIETAGNLTNPNLPDVGADILVQAGAGNGAQYESFYAEYFLTDSAEYSDVLNAFLQDKFSSNDEITAFLAQSATEQWQQIGEEFTPEILNAFYSELKETGRDTQNDFSRGYRAIDILFPETEFNREDAFEPSKLALIEPGESKEEYFNRLVGLSDYQGELRLFASKIYSLDGGNVDIMTPGGLVNAGLNTSPDPGALIGVVAQSFGSIRSFSRDDFQVNQSRVSTLLGGDIIMWSSIGDIDAGRGSKAAVSAPEPRVTIDAQGNINVDISNTVSGSGIRAVVIDPSVEPGDIDLIAPNGVIDAGDAGIAGSGNLFVAAEAIIGADNLTIGGLTVGVSTGAASGGSISTAGLGGGDVAAAATQAAQSAAADSADSAPEPEDTAEEQLTYLSVDIIGYGEEGADADDA